MKRTVPLRITLCAYLIGMLTGIIVIGLSQSAVAQLYRRIAIHGNILGNHVYGDAAESQVAPGGELGIQFKLSDSFSLVGLSGYHVLNDVTTADGYKTTFFPLSIGARFNITPKKPFNFYSGFSYGWALYQLTNASGTPLPGRPESQVDNWTEFFTAYAGVEYFILQNWSLNLDVQTAVAGTDLLDNIERGAVDNIAGVKLGVNFHFGRGGIIGRGTKATFEEDTRDFEAPYESSGDDFPEIQNNPDEENPLPPLPVTKSESTDSLHNRIERLEEELAALRELMLQSVQQQAGSAQPSLASLRDFEYTYELGRDLFESRQYLKAAAYFRSLVSRYPQHIMVSNAQYWYGESLYGVKRYEEALNAFEQIFMLTNRNKHDDAQIKIALCYKQLGRREESIAAFEELIRTYPESEYLDRARRELMRLR